MKVCPNCHEQTVYLYIDCTLSGKEREEKKVCPECRPEILTRSRRYVKDMREEYPLEQRLRDLAGSN